VIEFLEQNGIFIGASVILAALITYACYKHPQKIKEWLVFACAQAELALGSGTGMLKLRFVYDMFISQFPMFSKFISFSTFQAWTEDALVTFKEWVKSNNSQELFGEGEVK
jgi:membrane associated rhomboid family serine protease